MRFFARKRRAREVEAPFVREKRPLSEIERAVIDMAVSTMKTGQAEARAQLDVATYGGLAHPASHVCFMIDVPEGVERTPQSRDIVDLEVDSTPKDPLEITLFIVGGVLSSVDLTTYGDDSSGSRWPPLSRIHPPKRDD
jgi:hypothetical protein